MAVREVELTQAAIAGQLQQQLGGRSHRVYSIDQLLGSSCALIGETLFTRKDIIDYVANRAGGAHFNPKKQVRDEKARKYAILDNEPGRLNDVSSIHLELLSIGQFIGESTDAQRYLDEFAAVPMPEGVHLKPNS